MRLFWKRVILLLVLSGTLGGFKRNGFSSWPAEIQNQLGLESRTGSLQSWGKTQKVVFGFRHNISSDYFGFYAECGAEHWNIWLHLPGTTNWFPLAEIQVWFLIQFQTENWQETGHIWPLTLGRHELRARGENRDQVEPEPFQLCSIRTIFLCLRLVVPPPDHLTNQRTASSLTEPVKGCPSQRSLALHLDLNGFWYFPIRSGRWSVWGTSADLLHRSGYGTGIRLQTFLHPFKPPAVVNFLWRLGGLEAPNGGPESPNVSVWSSASWENSSKSRSDESEDRKWSQL